MLLLHSNVSILSTRTILYHICSLLLICVCIIIIARGSTARRLEAALLPTVDENGDGAAGVLRRQPGATQQYLKTASEQLCLAAEILVPCACTCLPQQNTLAPVAITLLPLAIQALSAHRYVCTAITHMHLC